MDTAIESKKEYVVFTVGILVILLILSRYIVNGEPVDIRSEITGETVALSDGMEIRQMLTIPEGINWRQGNYALDFSKSDSDSAGEIVCTLVQGGQQDVQRILLKEITAGEWKTLDGLEFGRLESGEAVLSIYTENVAPGELEIAVEAKDYHGFGSFYLDGNIQQGTLAQAYHYHISGMEYKARLLCYGVVCLCALALVILTIYKRIDREENGTFNSASELCGRQEGNKHGDTNGKCLAAFGILTVMFLAMIYVLDSSIYLEPTYAEAVTNFLRFAREEKFSANLLITDAGYLPLLPRLITLFYVKVLRVPSTSALYFMQGTACLLCSMVWSLFVLKPFQGLMRLPHRILWCIIVMLTCFCEETLFFTNHAYWGIYLLLLLLAADLDEFPGWIYAGLMSAAVLICLSKGTYVVMLPLMVLYLIFFRKNIGRRNKIYACVTGIASMLQLLYSFSGQGDGGSWIDLSSMSQIGYWFRLTGRSLVEFAAYMLLPFGRIVSHIPVLVDILAVAVFLFLLPCFVRKAVLPSVRGERIEKKRVAFYTVVMFQVIVAVFFLVTVKSVPDSWDKIGSVTFGQMGSKYEIFSNMGFYMLVVVGGALLMAVNESGQKNGGGGYKRICTLWTGFCRDYGILILMFLFCRTNPVMEFGGWAGAAVSDSRAYAGDIDASWQDCKGMISESCFFIPVRSDNWGYSHNINLYQVGTEIYFEETPCINLEEPLQGEHSFYEVQDETQAQNLIEVMINRPMRVDSPSYRVQLLDADGNVIAEAEKLDSGKNRKCLFRFEEPVNGVRTIQFTDETGNPMYYKDYIAWACAW